MPEPQTTVEWVVEALLDGKWGRYYSGPATTDEAEARRDHAHALRTWTDRGGKSKGVRLVKVTTTREIVDDE